MTNQAKNFKYMTYFFFACLGVCFLPFWESIVIAGIFALALQPVMIKIKGKTKNTPHKVIISIVVATTMAILTPILIGSISLSTKIVELSQSKDFKNNNITKIASEKITKITTELGISKSSIHMYTEKISSSLGQMVLKFSTDVISSIPSIVVNLLIFTLMLYIFLSYQGYIKDKIKELNLISSEHLDELVNVLQTSSTQILLSLIIVGFIQSLIVLIGAAIAGFSNLVLIFVITLACSFIPLIGAAPMAFILALWKLVEGNFGLALFLVIVGTVAGTIDNILKPMMVKRGIEQDASITLVAIIGAILIFGIPGLFIGPVVSTTAAYYFNKRENKDNK